MAKISELDNLPSNSDASKEHAAPMVKEVSQIQPVATGKRKDGKKRSKLSKFGDALFSTDDRPRTDITNDIVVPALKGTFLDVVSAMTGAVTNAFELALFGDMQGRTRSRERRGSHRNGYIDYSASSRSRGSEDRRRESSRSSRELQDFSEIDFDTWEDANEVLSNMKDLLTRYDRWVSVADFYALSGVSYTYQDRNWGWTDLSQAYPIRDGSSYILVLPKPEYIR